MEPFDAQVPSVALLTEEGSQLEVSSHKAIEEDPISVTKEHNCLQPNMLLREALFSVFTKGVDF